MVRRRPDTYICKTCEAPFHPWRVSAQFCSVRCAYAPRLLPAAPCRTCGKPVGKNRRLTGKYCSRACTSAGQLVPRPACRYCGQPCKLPKHAYCSRACVSKQRNIDLKARGIFGRVRSHAIGTQRLNSHSGYMVVKTAGGWKPEHRVVLSQVLGRPLLLTEQVHHRNGIKTDNHPDNLELWTRSHPYGQRVSEALPGFHGLGAPRCYRDGYDFQHD